MYTLENALNMELGSKAHSLAVMSKMGLNVPKAFVVSDECIKESFIGNKLSYIIDKRLADDGDSACEFIKALLSTLEPGAAATKRLAQMADTTKLYAVRSSATKEDMAGASFAGHYDTLLNVTAAELPTAVMRCYSSRYSESVLAMCSKHGIDPREIKMNVIVQEMLAPQVSGVVFTVNPTKLCDTQIVVEAVKGLGEGLVSGEVTPESVVYDWKKEKIVSGSTKGLLSEDKLLSLLNGALKIQRECGYPCDIEYSVEGDKIYFLQFRAITALALDSVEGQWTTANFKDSGVSAQVCKPYMWSLYKSIWDTSAADFFVDSKFFKRAELPALSETFFGRPYWNLGITKGAMRQIPTYVEREFDESLGVEINYPDDGEVTQINAKSIAGALKALSGHFSMLRGWKSERRYIYESMLEKYARYEKNLEREMSFSRAKKQWTQLIYNDHFCADTTYFKQIFINTVELPVYQKLLSRFTDNGGFFRLIGGLEDVSHMRPINAVYALCKKILADDELLNYWRGSTVEDIKADMANGDNSEKTADFRKIIETYGYHSEKELDVSCPCYCEKPDSLIELVRQNLDEQTLAHRQRELRESGNVYEFEKRRIMRRYGSNSGAMIIGAVKKLREQLWWREELRDVSTKYYYLVRMYTMRLAKCLCENGLMDSEDDIWYLPYGDILRLCKGELSAESAKNTVEKNRLYCESFRNYENPCEIGKNSVAHRQTEDDADVIKGVASNTGFVKGTARVISCADDLGTIRKGEILVAKYIDTGWSGRFSLLAGIVTENGGVLCHGSIVAREYGIPCIVAAKGVTKRILDGDVLCIDGSDGTVRKMEA